MKNLLKCAILLVTGCSLLAAVSGCGYTTRSMISNKYRTIYVVPFVNKIDITSDVYTGDKYKINKPMVETDVTKSIIKKFRSDGNLRPVDEESADLVLKGEVVDFRRDVVRYQDNNEDVQEYRINLVVNISLRNNKTKELVWEEKGFTGNATYFVTGALAKSENTAISDALADLGQRIVARTVEQW